MMGKFNAGLFGAPNRVKGVTLTEVFPIDFRTLFMPRRRVNNPPSNSGGYDGSGINPNGMYFPTNNSRGFNREDLEVMRKRPRNKRIIRTGGNTPPVAVPIARTGGNTPKNLVPMFTTGGNLPPSRF